MTPKQYRKFSVRLDADLYKRFCRMCRRRRKMIIKELRKAICDLEPADIQQYDIGGGKMRITVGLLGDSQTVVEHYAPIHGAGAVVRAAMCKAVIKAADKGKK